MKTKFWTHTGRTTVPWIKKQTGANRVLVPVTARMNAPGTALMATARLVADTSAPRFHYDVTVEPTWKLFARTNQDRLSILPLSLISVRDQKNMTYRIVELKHWFVWIEKKTKKELYGESYKNNAFLLIYNDDTERTST